MYSYRRSVALLGFLVLLGLVLIGSLFWANLWYLQRFPGGQQFEQIYQPARAFLLEGISPYGGEALTRTHQAIYGRDARPGEYPYALDVPFPLLALLLPLGLIPDKLIGMAFWMLLVELAVLALPVAIIRAAELAPRWPSFLLLVFLSTLWAPSFSAILAGSLFPIAFLALICSLIALRKENDELAGMLLALSMLRMEWLGLPWLLVAIWVVARERWRVAAGWGMTMILLNALGFIFWPEWPLEFLRAALFNLRSGYFPYTFGVFETSLPGVGLRLAQLMVLVAFLLAFWEWANARYKPTRLLFWVFGVTAALLPFSGLPLSQNSMLALLPGLLFGGLMIADRWRRFGVIFAILFSLVLFTWTWLQTLSGALVPGVFVTAFLSLLLLYWIRWWVHQPQKFWADLVAGE